MISGNLMDPRSQQRRLPRCGAEALALVRLILPCFIQEKEDTFPKRIVSPGCVPRCIRCLACCAGSAVLFQRRLGQLRHRKLGQTFLVCETSFLSLKASILIFSMIDKTHCGLFEAMESSSETDYVVDFNPEIDHERLRLPFLCWHDLISLPVSPWTVDVEEYPERIQDTARKDVAYWAPLPSPCGVTLSFDSFLHVPPYGTRADSFIHHTIGRSVVAWRP